MTRYQRLRFSRQSVIAPMGPHPRIGPFTRVVRLLMTGHLPAMPPAAASRAPLAPPLAHGDGGPSSGRAGQIPTAARRAARHDRSGAARRRDPARPGDRVLEAGTGAGAALLCLAARVPGIQFWLERDPALLTLARANAAANGWPDLMFAAADLAASPAAGGRFDHAFANPPYHPADGTPSPSAARDAAKRSAPDLLTMWVEALSRSLRHRGTLTLILRPRMLEEALTAMRRANVPGEWAFRSGPDRVSGPPDADQRPQEWPDAARAGGGPDPSHRCWNIPARSRRDFTRGRGPAAERRRRLDRNQPSRGPRWSWDAGDAKAAHARRPDSPCYAAACHRGSAGDGSASSPGCAAIARPPRNRSDRTRDETRSGSYRTAACYTVEPLLGLFPDQPPRRVTHHHPRIRSFG